jgi:NAD+ synthase (glutamine-hydrolysing)
MRAAIEARARRGEQRALSPVLLVGAPLRFARSTLQLRVVIHRGRVLGVARRATCPTTASSTRSASSPRRDAIHCARSSCSARRCPSARPRLRRRRTSPTSRSTSRSARTSGRRFRLQHLRRARRRDVLANLSASNITVGKAEYRHRSAPRSRASASRPTSTPRPVRANRPPTSPGTATRSSTRTTTCSPNRSASPRGADDHGRHRPRAPGAGPDAAHHLQRRRRPSTASASRHPAVASTSVPEGNAPAAAAPSSDFPYVPSDPAVLDERCYEAYNIQVHGLMKRLERPASRRS